MERNIFILLFVFYYFFDTFAQMCKGIKRFSSFHDLFFAISFVQESIQQAIEIKRNNNTSFEKRRYL
jgi:hypothetical protein